MKGKTLIVAVVCAIFLLVIKVRSTDMVNDEAVSTAQTEQLQLRTINRSIIASGNLNHEEQAQLSTEVIGKVRAIFVDEGDQVKKGQLLLTIDDEVYISAVKQNEAAVTMQTIAVERSELDYENVLSQWKRKKIVHDKKLIDDQTYEDITFRLSAAKLNIRAERERLIQIQAQLAQAKDNLARTRIYSPINGIVTSLAIKVGETAISGTTNFTASSLMTIVNPASLYAEINVDEADIGNVRVGQRVEVSVIAHSEQPLNGVVYFIGEMAKSKSGQNVLSIAVKIRFEEQTTLKLLPGMSIRAEIFLGGGSKKLSVPIQAVLTPPGKESSSYVFVNDNGRARLVPVLLGLSDDKYQEISFLSTNKLNVGDQILIGPDRLLRTLNDGESISAVLPPNKSDVAR